MIETGVPAGYGEVPERLEVVIGMMTVTSRARAGESILGVAATGMMTGDTGAIMDQPFAEMATDIPFTVGNGARIKATAAASTGRAIGVTAGRTVRGRTSSSETDGTGVAAVITTTTGAWIGPIWRPSWANAYTAGSMIIVVLSVWMTR